MVDERVPTRPGATLQVTAAEGVDQQLRLVEPRRVSRGQARVPPTISSATAWWARAALDQWVMCNPLATGSRHANATIWARWRGGNLLGVSRARIIGQDVPQPTFAVAPADAPDGGPIALQATVVCNELQKRGVRFKEGQWARLPTTHEQASTERATPNITDDPNLLHDFVAASLAAPRFVQLACALIAGTRL